MILPYAFLVDPPYPVACTIRTIWNAGPNGTKTKKTSSPCFTKGSPIHPRRSPLPPPLPSQLTGKCVQIEGRYVAQDCL